MFQDELANQCLPHSSDCPSGVPAPPHLHLHFFTISCHIAISIHYVVPHGSHSIILELNILRIILKDLYGQLINGLQRQIHYPFYKLFVWFMKFITNIVYFDLVYFKEGIVEKNMTIRQHDALGFFIQCEFG